MSEKTLTLYTFVGPECEGNGHQIIEREHCELRGHRDFIEISLAIQPTILVVLKPSQISSLIKGKRAHSSPILEPLFFHKGHQVQVCGSGLLSIPYYLVAQHKLEIERSLDIRLNEQNLQIRPVPNTKRFALVAELDTSLRYIEQGAWPAIVGAALKSIYKLNDAYLIAELDQPADLEKLVPDLEELCRVTDRALIVTAQAHSDDASDYLMRYFAPQYGNPEDAATGSANLYLMKYWQSKLNKPQLKARQLSPQGAMFYGEVSDSTVMLSGDARVV